MFYFSLCFVVSKAPKPKKIKSALERIYNCRFKLKFLFIWHVTFHKTVYFDDSLLVLLLSVSSGSDSDSDESEKNIAQSDLSNYHDKHSSKNNAAESGNSSAAEDEDDFNPFGSSGSEDEGNSSLSAICMYHIYMNYLHISNYF